MSIADKVTKIIGEQLGVDADEVIPEAAFKDLGADSLDVVELALALEEEFKIPMMSDEDIQRMAHVQDAIAYIEQRATLRT